MKIAFDAQLFLNKEKTGIAWCADNIVRELIKHKENEYILECFIASDKENKLIMLEDYKRLGFIIIPCVYFSEFIYKILSTVIPLSYSLFFKKKRDITIFFNYIVPPGVKGKTIAVVHDMAYKAYPETVREKTRKWLNWNLPHSLKRADKIITDSEFSKREVIKYHHISEHKIVVMPLGVDFKRYHNRYSLDCVENIKQKYNIDSQYFLYLGTLEPRKNIENIIIAYSKCINKNKQILFPKLVIAGRKGWMFESIFQKVTELKLEKKVIFTGYVEDNDTAILMQGAEIFIFPSIYEGFGLPPLEAMACGTPVITSNVSSLPEVVGNAAITVNPFSTNEISDAIEYISLNENIKKELSEKGLQQAQKFTWENSANILLSVYKELLNSK